MITKEEIVEMFDAMASNSDLNLSGPLLWGYFFTGKTREELERAAPMLEADGYRLARIYQSEKDAPDELDLWWLHVERVEHHNSDTLHQRNQALHRFADEQALGSYDGMDVGPLDDAQ